MANAKSYNEIAALWNRMKEKWEIPQPGRANNRLELEHATVLVASLEEE